MKRVLALQLGSLFPQQHRLRYLLHSDHHHCEVIGSLLKSPACKCGRFFSLSKNMCSRAQIRELRGSLRGSAAAAR